MFLFALSAGVCVMVLLLCSWGVLWDCKMNAVSRSLNLLATGKGGEGC